MYDIYGTLEAYEQDILKESQIGGSFAILYEQKINGPLIEQPKIVQANKALREGMAREVEKRKGRKILFTTSDGEEGKSFESKCQLFL